MSGLATSEGAAAFSGLAARQPRPELKALVAEASQALARLDAARLEELAVSCQALNRELTREVLPIKSAERETLEREAREAMGGMATFARVLQATRANLKVMHRLRELRMGHIEYSERQTHGWAATEGHRGNN